VSVCGFTSCGKTFSQPQSIIYKTCITKHKIDIKTRQEHRYNTIPIFRSIFFSMITLTYICFLSNTSNCFRETIKSFNILYTLHGHRLQSEEICNEYAAQTMFCQSQAFPTEKARFCLPSALKKSEFQNPTWQPSTRAARRTSLAQHPTQPNVQRFASVDSTALSLTQPSSTLV